MLMKEVIILDKFKNEYNEDYFEEDFGSRYRLKKRKRRKKTIWLLLIIVGIIGGGTIANSFFAKGSLEEKEQEIAEENKDIENNDQVTPLQEEDLDPIVDEEKQNNQDEKLLSNEIVNDQQPEEATIEHKVKAGDSLYKLSIQYYDSPKYQQFLAGFNNIENSNDLKVGQIVTIPFPPSDGWYVEEESDIIPASKEKDDIQIHEVKKGDTLFSISMKYYRSADYQDLIAERNGLDDPSSLKVGDQLEIPTLAQVN